ncbi:MAG TPA: hypothetical protein PLY56_00885 [Armatimonadota bacterium]|jgi:hypothetical protein|nr:hypothetical protein [Armatimonadota bacterium]HOJ20064.1 hypothetical protein [Armatimonadota bacterium]HOM81233.1 hypothetical protein [Armatimonadota bacterium]HOQ27192.1 hypothetical protein [Armatimonadota bacterium]HPO73596.1 hypothetical protein [Armatimonadota bacterium]
MATISRTIIGTDDTGYDLCKGFALFPKLGTLRAGLTVGDRYSPIISGIRINAVGMYFDLSAGVSFFAGICGPAYAFKFALQGNVDNNLCELTVTEDTTAAGIVWGVRVVFGINIGAYLLKMRWVWDGWNSRLETYYERAFGTQQSIPIDVMDIVIPIIRQIIKKVCSTDIAIDRANMAATAAGNLWGIYDERRNTFVKNNGSMRVDPRFMVPIDIVSLHPKMKAVMTALATIGGHFRTGPEFGFALPTFIKLNKATVDGAIYGNPTASGSLVRMTKTGGSAAPANPRNITLEMMHEPGFDLRVGWFFSIGVFYVLSFGKDISIPILELLGIRISLGKYYNSISNTVGATSTGRCIEMGAAGHEGEFEPIEVVFEPAEDPALVG